MLLINSCQESCWVETEINVTSSLMPAFLASYPKCMKDMTPLTAQFALSNKLLNLVHVRSMLTWSWCETGGRWQPYSSTFPS